MYPPELKQSVVQIQVGRDKRLKEDCPSLAEGDKTDLLEKYHPNYVVQGLRKIRVGPNKGMRAPKELADLLEGHSRVDPEVMEIGAVDYDVDVLVLGGGGAGAAAAILAQENGANVLLATKLRLCDANTLIAQGGIQAADKPDDSPIIHYLDTMRGGNFSNVPDLVEALVRDAPAMIQWLESLGCTFDKEADGTMCTDGAEGLSRKRLHTAGDYIGAEIMRTLGDEVLNRGITVLEYSPALELIMDDKGQVAGALLMNLETNEVSLVRAKTTVLATGGGGQLYYQGFPSTNHYGATADGLVLAYRVGAELLFIDTIQYYPTSVVYPKDMVGQLVMEKVRGLGAKLVNARGEQFICSRETEDVVTAAIIRECQRGLGVKTETEMQGVWLDTPMIELLHGAGTIQQNLAAMYLQFKRVDIDITKEPILVYPALHYQNGGIKIDAQGATTVANLYAAGEVSGGVHGRNKLKGNALLDILVYGRRAGKAAAQRARETQLGKLTWEHVKRWQGKLKKARLQKRPVSPQLLPDYARHSKVMTPDWQRRYRFELRKERVLPRLQPVDTKYIEVILNNILDAKVPPVARMRLLSSGFSTDHKLDIMEDVTGSRTCLGCGNCNDICPLIAREPSRRERTEERTSMALETILVGEDCDRCQACVLVCPQVNVTIKQYIVNRRAVETMSRLDSRIGDDQTPDLDLFVEETIAL
jgi:succinate dehydrogenase / fumarate reductase flavoprotein subunit